MTATTGPEVLDFTLDQAHEADEPPEARGLRRDGVRLLVSPGESDPVDSHFGALGSHLRAGDLLVVNTSATVPAALDGRLPDGEPIIVHLSGALPGEVWLVEVRRPNGESSTAPLWLDHAVEIELLAGGTVRLLTRFSDSKRLWIATFDLSVTVAAYAADHGRPIRYRHVPREWALSYYQTIFAREPGSAEMPSASRPFTPELVTDLIGRGVSVAPLLLHTGVSSLEGGERPYPERYLVPETTASAINDVRHHGGRVIAVGTTVVRALATVTDEHGVVHPGQGWTEVVVTADAPVSSVDGLLTGWHEPESSHLQMLEAFAGRAALERAYRAALDLGYRWHEFGDSHLILRGENTR
ncbi:MAG: S-adenosylmethionine:tRNA ribosyltransferase-isomerase [Acidimicrobiia bacterium]